MKYILVFLAVVFLIVYAINLQGIGHAIATEQEATVASHTYPIAPGVWYPGEPLPEKPMRYYRVRCFPGCHHGSSHGKYPNEPLNMKPIFPTSTIDRISPDVETDKK